MKAAVDLKERKCGCITYLYGPPHVCPKHQKAEERGLRTAVRAEAEKQGHTLASFTEYESQRGKWTTFCERCCAIVIVYDAPQERFDQVNGPGILERLCEA